MNSTTGSNRCPEALRQCQSLRSRRQSTSRPVAVYASGPGRRSGCARAWTGTSAPSSRSFRLSRGAERRGPRADRAKPPRRLSFGASDQRARLHGKRWRHRNLASSARRPRSRLTRLHAWPFSSPCEPSSCPLRRPKQRAATNRGATCRWRSRLRRLSCHLRSLGPMPLGTLPTLATLRAGNLYWNMTRMPPGTGGRWAARRFRFAREATARISWRLPDSFSSPASLPSAPPTSVSPPPGSLRPRDAPATRSTVDREDIAAARREPPLCGARRRLQARQASSGSATRRRSLRHSRYPPARPPLPAPPRQPSSGPPVAAFWCRPP
mmetsp:Transcript_106147/g.298417  ORF Transcript_106147/g.298417 Transcript_106147/m.298417 type:complete len:324 (-) Transcript_106147:2346-3317(-)